MNHKYKKNGLCLAMAALCLVISAGCAKKPRETGATQNKTTADARISAAAEATASGSASDTGKSENTSGKSTKSNARNTTDVSLPGPTQSSGEEDTWGMNYMAQNDKFYKKANIYVTWLNVWNGSTEFWWAGLAASSSVNGIKGMINGQYACVDSNNPVHRKSIAKAAFDAGIDVLAMDLTNGYSGWRTAAKDYQRLCYENGRKFTVAVHPRDSAEMETMCQYIWNNYAGAGVTPYSPAYLYKNGKPLVVLYCTKQEFVSASGSTGEYSGKFSFVWASGEDSEINKWGWQIEPQEGPMASSDSMYVTPSVDWNSPHGTSESWRSSLAMLDFCFLAAKENKPKFTIVGSMDDLFERNGWMKADTAGAFYQMPLDPDQTKNLFSGRGLQMRDAAGSLNQTVYYDRVKSWIQGTAKAFHSGGPIADGAYTITNKASGKGFGVIRPEAGQSNDIGAGFRQNWYLTTKMEAYYWFYHLGNNEYRVIKLSSGLSLQPDSQGNLVQQWTDAVDQQRWKLSKQGDGSFRILNVKTNKALYDSGVNHEYISTASESNGTKSSWVLTPVQNRIIR